MTENKRFHFGYVLGDTGLIDEQSTEHKWFIENCCSVSDLKKNWKTVCDKLNEVAEENEQLKQQIKIFEKFLEVNDLDIDWVEFCGVDECAFENPDFSCQECIHLKGDVE